MKVISKLAKGHKLYPIDKLNIRPTLSHIKESIFNMIMFRVENCFFKVFLNTKFILLNLLN
ncbi:MAG: RsmD family RNA methyltransferase [Firmicutes bacterium]|nr:RsmD family RNA methyltransferase [Bacillota bacterium]